MGVEPIPPAPQAGVQKPLHYGHHVFRLAIRFLPFQYADQDSKCGTPCWRRGMMSISQSVPVLSINTERKARESNPHHSEVKRVSSASRQTVSGYLPYVSGAPGSRTPITWVQAKCHPVRPASRSVSFLRKKWRAGGRTRQFWLMRPE
jgi:hypothetical protein